MCHLLKVISLIEKTSEKNNNSINFVPVQSLNRDVQNLILNKVYSFFCFFLFKVVRPKSIHFALL